MSRVHAFDPGSEQSALVIYDTDAQLVLRHGIYSNRDLLEQCRAWPFGPADAEAVFESMAPRGMPTSLQELETVHWAGRFYEVLEARGWTVGRLSRHKVKIHHGAFAGPKRAGEKRPSADAIIRASLIDRFGDVGGKDAAIGRKAAPGPLYGIAADEWAALALAVAWTDGVR
ncbi:MAG: hypothetical protein QOJ81_1320 [Chloroflexota bacterium]|nr:hypothetical protein [Chloroflexota bacterium]